MPFFNPQVKRSFVLCYKCGNLAWEGWDVAKVIAAHPYHNGGNNFVHLTGAEVFPDFITASESTDLVNIIDKTSWVDSQSGRRKQVPLSACFI